MQFEHKLGVFWVIWGAGRCHYAPVVSGQTGQEAAAELGILVPWSVERVGGIGTCIDGTWSVCVLPRDQYAQYCVDMRSTM